MSASRPLRLLIADDDPLVTFCLRAQLTNLGHQVVAEAADGQEAVSLARQLHPDVILMDIKMPNMDGLEASKQIDQDGLCPIILLSAYSGADLVQKARSLSVQAYLVKPVDGRDLEPAIELAVDRFRQVKRLQHETTYLRKMRNAQSALRKATEYLVANFHCSPHQAQEWVQQEARAKRAGLYEVARAIVGGKTVSYHYDVPI